MRRTSVNRTFAAVTIGAIVVAVTAASCKKKDDEIVPPPTATPAPTPPPTLDLAVVDAGPEGGDADAEAGKTGVGNYDPTRLMACCKALEQNAKTAPPIQAPAMLAAAQACKAAVSSGNFKAAAGYGCK
jgi:hypothetical protein